MNIYRRTMDNEISIKQPEKDKSLADLERMLEKLPENARKPILDLIHRRKVELGLLESELKPAGYILKKRKSKPASKPEWKKEKKPEKKIEKNLESLRNIAKTIGTIKEKEKIVFHDVAIIDESSKEKKVLKDIDSYKY